MHLTQVRHFAATTGARTTVICRPSRTSASKAGTAHPVPWLPRRYPPRVNAPCRVCGVELPSASNGPDGCCLAVRTSNGPSGARRAVRVG